MTLPQMSVAGAVMILAIAVVRALTLHRLPKNAFLVLWGVAAARLLAPYSLPSAFSVYSLLGRLAPAAEMAEDIPVVISAVIPTVSAGPVPPPSALSFPWRAAVPLDPWVILWMLGAVVCVAYFAAAYFKCRREFRASLPVDSDYAKHWFWDHPLFRAVQLRQTGRISAPLTYGLFRPVILMPKTTDWEDRDTLCYVLAHEYAHIRRFDAVTKLVIIAALCVHWFNPAVWLMVLLANRDMELACDEAVIRHLGEDARSAYAMTLIRMEEGRGGPFPLYSNFSSNATEERIIAIMKTRKFSLLALTAAAALVIGVTIAFATSARDSGSPGSIDSDPTSDIISADEEGTGLYTRQEIADQTAETKELLELYAPFGLTYEYETDSNNEITLRMEWQGRPVHSVYDGKKAVWIANSMQGLYLGPDAVDLEAVYEDGRLTGLRETGAQDPVGFKYYVRGESTTTPHDGDGYTSPQENEPQSVIEDFYYYVWDGDTMIPYNGGEYISPQETQPQLDMEVFYYRSVSKDGGAADWVRP